MHPSNAVFECEATWEAIGKKERERKKTGGASERQPGWSGQRCGTLASVATGSFSFRRLRLPVSIGRARSRFASNLIRLSLSLSFWSLFERLGAHWRVASVGPFSSNSSVVIARLWFVAVPGIPITCRRIFFNLPNKHVTQVRSVWRRCEFEWRDFAENRVTFLPSSR